MHHIKVIKDGNVNNVVKEQLVDGVQYVDDEPREGSLNGITSGAVAKVAGDVGDVKDVIPEGTSEENPLVNETVLGEVAERVTTAEGDIESIEEKIPSGASSSNKLVTESDLEDAQDSWQSGFTPKGEATVSQIDGRQLACNGVDQIVEVLGIVADELVGDALGATCVDGILGAVLEGCHFRGDDIPQPTDDAKGGDKDDNGYPLVSEEEFQPLGIDVVQTNEEGLGLEIEPALLLAALQYLGGQHGGEGEG